MDMANRVPVDLEGLRERVENARSDSAWKELSLSKKVRILLQERLEEVERTRQEDILVAGAKDSEKSQSSPQTIAELVERNYRQLLKLGGVGADRLEAYLHVAARPGSTGPSGAAHRLRSSLPSDAGVIVPC